MDNTILPPGGGGDTIATDDVAGVKHQRVLIEFGPDGAPVQVNTGASALPIQDGGNSLTIDGSVSLAAAIPAGTNNIGDVDVLTVPAPLSTAGNGTAATALRVTLANDGTGVVDTELPAAAALADGAANPTTPTVGAALLGYNGATFDRLLSGLGTPAKSLRTVAARSATPSQSSVAGSASSVTVLASNTSRMGATIYNDSTATLYLKLGATASTSSFTVLMSSGAYYEVPFNYTGIIDGIWASATGNARVTELT